MRMSAGSVLRMSAPTPPHSPPGMTGVPTLHRTSVTRRCVYCVCIHYAFFSPRQRESARERERETERERERDRQRERERARGAGEVWG